MTATVRLGDGTAIALDVIAGHPALRSAGVLLTIEGKTHGEVLNCAFIPRDKVGAVLESLRLVASQLPT